MVDKSLARGLRQRAIVTYRDLEAKYVRSLGAMMDRVVYDAPWSAKRARMLDEGLRSVGLRYALSSGYISDMKAGKHKVIVHYTPRLENDRFFVVLSKTRVHPRHPPHIVTSSPILELTEHVVERLFMRLRTMSFEAVQRELRSSFPLIAGLENAAIQLGLKQVPLPTFGGVLLCTYETPKQPLLARTWIRNNEEDSAQVSMSKRWVGVLADLRAQIMTMTTDELWLSTVGYQEERDALTALCAKSLGQHPWLREPYSKREDNLGAIWQAARAQAE